MMLGLLGYYTLTKFGSEGLLGSAAALSLIRELEPVLQLKIHDALNEFGRFMINTTIGELSVSDGKARSATVVAIEDSDLLIMRREASWIGRICKVTSHGRIKIRAVSSRLNG